MAIFKFETTVDTSTTPPTITHTPATDDTPPPAAGKGYRVKGRHLLDPNGDRVVVVGVEQRLEHVNWIPPGPEILQQIGMTGANTVRILPNYREDNGLTATEIEAAVVAGLSAGMFVELAVDGGHDPAVYLDPPIMSIVKRWQRHIGIHLVGESKAGSDDTWTTEVKRAVGRARDAGIECPLYVMSRVYGRSLTCLINRGAEVQEADPLHNIVFGWQAYWGLDVNVSSPMTSKDGYYQRENGMSLEQAMTRVAALPFPVQVGLMHHSDPEKTSREVIPYRALMERARKLQIGWLWWDYREGPDNLTQTGRFGEWTDYGRVVIRDDPNGITKAATRTSFQRALTVTGPA